LPGSGPGDRMITYEEFASVPLLVARVAESGPGGSTVDVGGRSVRVHGSWPSQSLVVVRLRAPDAADGEVVAFSVDGAVRPGDEVAPGAKVR